nr:T4SS effector SidA family protein [Legionella norrlandica]
MANNCEDSPILSNKMLQLKKKIQAQTLPVKTLKEKIQEGISTATSITIGISKFFNILSALLSSYRGIPIIGGVLQFLAVLAKSISIISDPEKSVTEKIISSLLIATLVTLSVIALTLGTVAAAIIGTIVASVITIVEGINFFGKMLKNID